MLYYLNNMVRAASVEVVIVNNECVLGDSVGKVDRIGDDTVLNL